MMLKCETCGGVYAPMQPGGFHYYHACPPVFDAGAKGYVERADKRDENVVVTGADAKGAPIVALKAEGKGAIAAPAVEEAVVDVPA